MENNTSKIKTIKYKWVRIITPTPQAVHPGSPAPPLLCLQSITLRSLVLFLSSMRCSATVPVLPLDSPEYSSSAPTRSYFCFPVILRSFPVLHVYWLIMLPECYVSAMCFVSVFLEICLFACVQTFFYFHWILDFGLLSSRSVCLSVLLSCIESTRLLTAEVKCMVWDEEEEQRTLN